MVGEKGLVSICKLPLDSVTDSESVLVSTAGEKQRKPDVVTSAIKTLV